MNTASQIATTSQTASQITAAASRKPRSRSAPSQRDQQIYLDYQTSGIRQAKLAEKYKLTQCRISQIIRRVEAWLNENHQTNDTATGSIQNPKYKIENSADSAIDESQSALPERSSIPVDSEEDCATQDAARLRLLHQLERERLNTVCREAMRHFHDQQKTVAHKTGTRAGKEIDETTERQLPPNIQCLKVVLQANSQLSRLEKKSSGDTGVSPVYDRANDDRSVGPASAQSAGPPAGSADDQGREYVEHWLVQHRDATPRGGLSTRGFDSQTVVQDLVSALLGQPGNGYGLLTLADESGKKIVDRKPYDDNPPKLPPNAHGWHYPMYDYHGGLVAWLSADQLAGAVHPDYPPVSRDSSGGIQSEIENLKSEILPASTLQSEIRNPQSKGTSSTTSHRSPNSSQPTPAPALTASSASAPFSALTLNDPGLSGVIEGTPDCGVV